MTCCLYGAKPSPELIVTQCLLDTQETIQLNLNDIFPQTYQTVICKMAAILPMPQYVKTVIDCDFASLQVLNGMNRNIMYLKNGFAGHYDAVVMLQFKGDSSGVPFIYLD